MSSSTRVHKIIPQKASTCYLKNILCGELQTVAHSVRSFHPNESFQSFQGRPTRYAICSFSAESSLGKLSTHHYCGVQFHHPLSYPNTYTPMILHWKPPPEKPFTTHISSERQKLNFVRPGSTSVVVEVKISTAGQTSQSKQTHKLFASGHQPAVVETWEWISKVNILLLIPSMSWGCDAMRWWWSSVR